MRIDRILINNYRQFLKVELDFEKKNTRDLHLIIGKSGTCKTNILNAINWCLYGDEPHLSKDSQTLPILNLKVIEESGNGVLQKVSVRLDAKANDGSQITFQRRTDFRVYKKDMKVEPVTKDFDVEITPEAGDTKLFNDMEAETQVDRFVPKRLREYFFFDGERLDRYFREATAQKIKHAVFEISQIDLLERIETRMDNVAKELRKEAGRSNPQIEDKREILEKYEERLKENKDMLTKVEEQIAIAKEKVNEYGEKLKGIPDIRALETKLDSLKEEKKEKERILKGKTEEKNDMLFEYGKYIPIWPIIRNTISSIAEKIEKKEIPPNIDPDVLEKIKRNKYCSVCHTKLTDEGIKAIDDLLSKFKLSSEISKILIGMQTPLSVINRRLGGFESSLRKITGDVDTCNRDLKRIEKGIDDTKKEIGGYDVENVKAWNEERAKWEDIYAKNLVKVGMLKKNTFDLSSAIKGLKEDITKELKKEAKMKDVMKQINFVDKSVTIIAETKQKIMEEVRKRLETRTKEVFLDLLWKDKTFKDVKIGEDYALTVIHSSGYECLGSLGATEREFLALAFTLALHEISGFASPILIDTPVARVDTNSRINFGKMFLEVSKNKQTILLFNQAEYSAEISNILDCERSTKYISRMERDEKVTEMEVA